MTSTTPHNRRSRVRTVAAVIAALTVFGLADHAEAARPSTESSAIAERANDAVVAFERWAATGQLADYAAFTSARDEAAMLTAVELDLDVADLVDEWSDADVAKQRTVLAAMSQLGVPYRSMASEPGVGFDCSGLTIWAYGSADVEIPRVSGDQINASAIVDRTEAEPGDLVHYPGHVGIYLGGDSYVHSPYTGVDVEAVRLPDRSLSFGDLTDQ